MSWLLGFIGAGGLAGAVLLGVLIYRTAGKGHEAMQHLVETTKMLATKTIENGDLQNAVEDFQNALDEQTLQLGRERAARAVAEEALADAARSLASRGDSPSIAAGLNRALQRLSQMSDVPGAGPAEGNHED